MSSSHASDSSLLLSCNWLNDAVAPAVVDLLQNNSILLSLDLQGNKSLKSDSKERYRYRHGQYETIRPAQERGKAGIVKGALCDTTSLQAIANSNHTCAVYLSGQNSRSLNEETIRKSETLPLLTPRLFVSGVLTLFFLRIILSSQRARRCGGREDPIQGRPRSDGGEQGILYDPRSFNDVPLELIPYLIVSFGCCLGHLSSVYMS